MRSREAAAMRTALANMNDNCHTASMDRSSSAGPLFPQEIFDIVIDYLHGDLPALKECSLVCRPWLVSSSLHLLESVKWPPPCRYHRSTSRRRKPDTQLLRPCLPFATLVHRIQTSARLQASIRSLRLSSYRDEQCSVDYEQLSFAALRIIIDSLPRLRKLDVISVVWGSDVLATHGDGGPRTIEVLRCHPHSTRIVHLPCLFRHIQRLEFVSATDMKIPPSSLPPIAVQCHEHRTEVDSVVLPLDQWDTSLEIFWAQLKPESILGLTLGEDTCGYYNALLNIIQSAINVEHADYWVHLSTPGPLRSWPLLRYLTVHDHIGSYLGAEFLGVVGVHGDGLRRIIQHLSGLRSKCLEELVICAYCTDRGHELHRDNVVTHLEVVLPESDWQQLCQILAGFRSLKKLSFKYVTRRGTSDADENPATYIQDDLTPLNRAIRDMVAGELSALTSVLDVQVMVI